MPMLLQLSCSPQSKLKKPKNLTSDISIRFSPNYACHIPLDSYWKCASNGILHTYFGVELSTLDLPKVVAIGSCEFD
jgi:hypothetical protein